MIAFLIFLLSTSVLVAQTLPPQPTPEDISSACSGDTLDIFPTLPPGYCNEAVIWSRREAPWPLKPLFRSVDENGKETYVEYEFLQRSWNETIRVLAWSQERTAFSARYQNQKRADSMGYTLWNLLLWSKSIDDGGKPQWILLLLECSIDNLQGNVDTSRWSLSSFKKEDDMVQQYFSMVYSAPPNNEQIYQFIEWSFLAEQLEQTTAIRGIGADMIFLMGGDVREKTWEACVGEAPTKFFFFEK